MGKCTVRRKVGVEVQYGTGWYDGDLVVRQYSMASKFLVFSNEYGRSGAVPHVQYGVRPHTARTVPYCVLLYGSTVRMDQYGTEHGTGGK